MDLARAFTKRNKRPDAALLTPARAASMRNHSGPIKRSAISHPLELLSTTNILAYNAPDLHSAISSANSSADDSDSSINFSSSRGTSPDTSSIESAPSPVEPNHLTDYFRAPGRSQSSAGKVRRSNDSSDVDVPSVPSRALSHTKKSHQEIARQRSISKSIPPPTAIHSPSNARGSIDMFSSKPDVNHPFGAELEQVNELAEEIGARDVMILDDEELFLMSHGLQKFGAEEYLDEIEGLFGAGHGNPFSPFGAGWI